MKLLSSIILTISLATQTLAAPTPGVMPDQSPNPLARRNTPNAQGTNNGYFYSFWSDGGGSTTYTNGAAGKYTVTWNGSGDFTCGKGWNPGSARYYNLLCPSIVTELTKETTSRTINFSGSYSATSSGSLAVYGWTTNPLVEYYIMENWVGSPSSGLTYKTSFSSDGATYNVYTNTRTNQPSIIGTATFQQYISIRQSKRTTGSVNTANHFNKWASLGLPLGTHNYQIMSVESWSGSGSASITVS
ncbi:hypothetical protein H072_350 [Dactylellina haptotyla CBS 200.50]|uniref:Endo-1,4-beta-xylanase n=1 Tax=Dactylellina haptotyla (strain CBS 200.50) TaxID=1284197 RepID=S8AS02_DACHA|nr:hypothetical protein H072_350 [Dactylellina haptotyla CBS 200.50]